MPRKNSQAPAAPDATEESGGAETAEETKVETTQPATPGSEEAIRQAAAQKLESKAGEMSVKLQKAEGRANALEGELEREKKARASAEARITELEQALAAANTAAKNAGTAIAGLPDNARQLSESVTIPSATPGIGKGGRIHAKDRDVVIVTKDDDEVAELQKMLGQQAMVYKVTKATLDELETLGHLLK